MAGLARRQLEDFGYWYKPDGRSNEEQKAFEKTKFIPLLEKHPALMKERLEKSGEPFEIPQAECLYIVGDKNSVTQKVRERISSKKVLWVNKTEEVPFEYRFSKMVILNPTLLDKVQYPSKCPWSLQSPIARVWSNDIRFRFLLSEKGFYLR